MKKPVVIAIVIGVLVGVIGGGGYLWMKKGRVAVPPTTQQEETQAKLQDWKDPAGFMFQYPEGVVINKHDEDKENYAHVEMTNPMYPGRLIVWGKDTTALDVAAWVKTEKTFRDGSIVDTTLGAKPAKKILITTPIKKIIVGTIFDDLLWFIEVEPGEGDYWQKTFDTISQSFKFTPLPGESSAGGGDTSIEEDVMVDEEEVIE